MIITHLLTTTTAAAALEACGVDSARAPLPLRVLARGALRYNIKFRQARQRLYTQQAQDGEAHQPPLTKHMRRGGAGGKCAVVRAAPSPP